MKAFLDIPGEFLRPIELDVVPQTGSTIKLEDDDGSSYHTVRFVEHRFYRPEFPGSYQDQEIVVHLSEELTRR